MQSAEAVWKKVSAHIGGVAMGATLCALHFAGHKVRSGYHQIALRVLNDMGQTLIAPHPHPDTAQALATAMALQHSFKNGTALPELTPFLEYEAEGMLTVEGPVAASVMTELYLSGFFERRTGHESIISSRLRPCLDFLSGIGWWNAARQTFTDQGKIAVSITPQYFHTAGYLRLFNILPRIMLGDPVALADLGRDVHLRRDIDIASSTRVFEATCRKPLREIILPLFDAPLDKQPAALVDTGCGEGTTIAGLYRDIRARTRRGSHLTEQPLTLVGIDPSAVARRICESTLATLDAPFHVLDGDIGSPESLAENLRSIKLDPVDALHMSKSVFHNRRLQALSSQYPGRQATTQNVFIGAKGATALAAVVEEDLLQLARRWKPLAERHGLLVIEAHTLNASGVQRRDLLPILAMSDATHGYTGQYLLEADVFQAIFREAGLRPYKVHAVGSAAFGSPIMTIGLYRSD